MALGVKRGVSPVVATLIMVAATITLGSFAYWYVTNFVTSSSQHASIGIMAIATNSSKLSTLQLSLKNLGSVAISVEKVKVWHERGLWNATVNRVLAAGATFSMTISNESLVFIPGKSYTIVIITNVGNFTATAVCIGG